MCSRRASCTGRSLALFRAPVDIRPSHAYTRATQAFDRARAYSGSHITGAFVERPAQASIILVLDGSPIRQGRTSPMPSICKRDTSRRWQCRSRYQSAAISELYGFALDNFVRGQVGRTPCASSLINGTHKRIGNRSFIEAGEFETPETLQSVGERRLPQNETGRRRPPPVEKALSVCARWRNASRSFAICAYGGRPRSLACKSDRRASARERHLAVAIDTCTSPQAPRDRNRCSTANRSTAMGLPYRRSTVRCLHRRGGFARIHHDLHGVGRRCIRKKPPAESRRIRLYHSERRRDCNRRIERVSATLQHGVPGGCRKRMCTRDRGRLLGAARRRDEADQQQA